MWLGAALALAACGGGGAADGGDGCTSNADCTVTGQVCQTLTSKTCDIKCESVGDCGAGEGCDATTGLCFKQTVSDAGTDAGVLPTTCNSMNPEPDVCGHTNVCTSANTCEAIVDGTCTNIASSSRADFTSASTGAVIFNIVPAGPGANDDTFCTVGTNAFTGTIYAYAPLNSTFGVAAASLPAGAYYKSDGSSETITGKYRPSGYTQLSGGKVMSLKVTLCSANASTLEAGFGFDNGNGYCVSLTR